MLTIARGTQCNLLTDQLAIISGIGISMIFNAFFMMVNFFPDILFGKLPKSKRAVKGDSRVRKIDPVKPAIDPNQPRDITSGINSPYIKQDAKPEQIIVDGKVANLYRLRDLLFDFYKRPHILLAGESGSGKTVTLFNLIQVIKQQYENCKFVIIDFGNQDFSQTYPTDLQTFLDVTEHLFYIMKGRQQEGKDPNRTRIIWLVEEFESVLAEVELLPKKDRDAFYVRLANIGRMSRKLSLNMIFVTQSAKADLFNTAIRNNFGFRFVMRLENSRLASSFGCNYGVGNLPTGVSWISVADAFVQFDKTTEPNMDMIPYHDLKKLANYYTKKYNLIVAEN